MTANELSIVMRAIRDLGERVDKRIDRLEDTVIAKHDERITVLEDAELVRTGARGERGRWFGASRQTIALFLTGVGSVGALVVSLLK